MINLVMKCVFNACSPEGNISRNDIHINASSLAYYVAQVRYIPDEC